MLGRLIEELKKHDPNKVVRHGFTNPHSYRGYYHDLAFEPAGNVTIGSMLEAAESAMDETFTGWKGGEFTMDEFSTCWLAYEGACSDGDQTIGPLLLNYMLNDVVE